MRTDRRRHLLLDLLIAAVALAVAITPTWQSWGYVHPSWVEPALVLGSGALMGPARRWPVPVFAAQAILVVVGERLAPFGTNMIQVMLLVALAFLAYRHTWPTIVVSYLVGCLVTGFNVVDPASGIALTWWRIGGIIALVAFPVVVGRYIAELRTAARVRRQRAIESAAHRDAQLRAARLAERTRIARDLHDLVAHHVGAMVLRAGAATLARPSPPVADALTDIRTTGTRVLEDLRGLLVVLRDPEAVDDPDPDATLADAVEQARDAGLPVTVRPEPNLAAVPSPARATVARTVQEGLTNVWKHAGPGTATTVELTMTPETVTVTIDNDPPTRRPDSLPSSGYGLAGMRERAAILGGRVDAGTRPDGGWRLRMTLPAILPS